MKIQYTPEAWTCRGGSAPHYQGEVYDENTGNTVAVTYNDKGGHKAQRIVACVNACDGINPEAVPDLLAALLEIAAENEDGLTDQDELIRCADIARAAIAKATGQESGVTK